MTDVAVWGDFEVRFGELLGRGGMGSVYKARQLSLDRWVAVKVLDTSRAPDPELARGFLEKFHVEAKALARLNDPRILTILQAGQNEGRYWYAMELVEGRTVERRLSEEGAIPEREAARVALEVARALDAAFRQGIIHRDVKPANIFLGADGAVKLGDFGLARGSHLSRTAITDANAVACTPAYASPEQADGKPTDHRSDIYSLGCVLYEMVTERPPFAGESRMDTLLKHASEPPPAPRLLNPGVSEELEKFIFRCLEKDPADRFQSYDELIRALEFRPPARRRDWFWPAAAAAGLALFGAIVAAVFLNAAPSTGEVRVAPPPPREPLTRPAPPPPPPSPPPAPPEDPVAALLERHRPSAEELAALRELLASSRGTLVSRLAYRFDGEIAEAVPRTPWGALFAEAERERVRAAAEAFRERPLLAAGREVTLVLRDGRALKGAIVSAEPDAVTLRVPDRLDERVALASISPLTFPAGTGWLVRAGAGDARSALADLERLAPKDRRRHAPGVVDQAIEEALLAAKAGDLRPLRGLDVPRELREPLEALFPDRLKLLDEERSAAELHAAKAEAELLLGRPHTHAGALAAREAREAFERSLPEHPDFELVGEVPFGTWRPDLEDAPNGAVRFDSGEKTYVLSAPGADERAWMLKPLRGARQGYRIRFRPPALADALLVVQLRAGCRVEIDAKEVVVHRKGFAPRPVERVGRNGRATLTVAPRPGVVCVYVDGRLIAALPEQDCGLDDGLKLGVGRGTVILESIRVRDRSN